MIFQTTTCYWLDAFSAPSRNACHRLGEWQSSHICFRAPRFDASEKAKLVRVVYDGLWVQNDVDVGKPARGQQYSGGDRESAYVEGDHSSVVFRNTYWRPLREIIAR